MIISKNKIRILLGVLGGIAAAVVAYSFGGALIKSIGLVVCFVAAGLFQIELDEKCCVPVAGMVLFGTGGIALVLSQFVQNEGFGSLGEGNAIAGFFLCAAIAFSMFAIWPNLHASVSITLVLALVLATVNWYVYLYRGSEFVPIDVLSVGTARNIIGQYRFELTPNIAYGWIAATLVIFLLCGVKLQRIARKSRCYTILCGGALAVLMCFAGATRGEGAVHFGNGGTYYNGFLLNFTLSAKELFVEKPEGYSADSVARIYAEYVGEQTEESGNLPNIIVIMDEAYADFDVLGEGFVTAEAVSPFIDSLSENTVRGYALSSAYGGRTANSEFEFLTGATMGFAPRGTSAYQQYIKEETISLATVLKSRGYSTVAMHPYLANGWTRNTVWPNLGFEECYFIEDFPQKNLLRGLVSDQEMMEYVVSRFEMHEEDGPLFLFGVTMQNHSDYVYEGAEFAQTDYVQGVCPNPDEVNQYLTLIRETDRAIEYLVNYLSEQEENTMLVFFGDHLPAFPEYYEVIRGGAFETLEQQKAQYTVPFFIWANYDITEASVELTSLSYLSTLLFETAGMEQTPYQDFLKDVQNFVPAINMNGYYSLSDGVFQERDEAEGVEALWLNRYQQIQYHYLFGNPNPAFYGVVE